MRIVAAALSVGVLVWAAEAAGGASCVQATRDAERAQQELSAASREADARGAAYHGCMQGGRAAACSAQKQAWEGAVARRGRALDALRTARAAREQACR
ncbi:MAG: hypothetical protein HY908_07175 [Myxococcales bacterium]|nr:hypothetical protein [Myxococcales bacterium]